MLLALALALAAAPAVPSTRTQPATPRKKLTVNDLFARPLLDGNRPDGALPSPDGHRVAFIWNDRGERSPNDLWFVPADGSTPPVNLTHFADPTLATPGSARPWKRKKGDEPRRMGVESFDWSPRGDFLVLAAGGDLWSLPLPGKPSRLTDTEAGEANPKLAPDGSSFVYESGGDLWLWALTPGPGPGPGPVVTQLTRHEDGFSFGNALWSPLGDRIAAIRRNDKERFDLVIPDYLPEKVEAGKSRGGWYSESVAVVPRSGGEPLIPDLGRDAPFSVNAFRFSPDGKRLLVDGTSKNEKVRTLHQVELDGGPGTAAAARLLDREEDERWVFSSDGILTREVATDFSPDGSHVMFLSERSGYAQPWIIDLADTEPRPHRVGTGAFETTWAAWVSPTSLVSVDARSATQERRPWLVDVGSGTARELGPLPGLSANAVISKDRSLLLVSHSRLVEPSEIVAVHLPDGHSTTLTHSVPPRFHTIDWIEPRFVTLSAFDGTPLKALVWEPATTTPPSTSRPAVIFVHGAGYMQDVLDGWTIYSPNFKFATLLVQRGFLVAEVDYRGSSGYGREFRTGIYKHMGSKDLDDIVVLSRWLKEKKGASKIGIYGGSYGGFAALMALFQHPADFDAAAALRFVSDWENYFRGNPWYCTQRLGTPDEDPEAYRRSSPINFVEGLRAPLLLLHGMKDDNVHFQDAVQLTARLIELGKPFEQMIYPREGHGFASPEGWIDGYGRIEEFFVRTLANGAPDRRRSP